MKSARLKLSLNNKGQSLVIFVALLPILLLIIAFIFELGNLSTIKNKYENEIKSTIEYGLNNQNDENLQNKLLRLLNENIEGNKEVQVDKDEIKVHVTYNPKGIYPSIFKQEFVIDLTYKGQFTTGKIEKE